MFKDAHMLKDAHFPVLLSQLYDSTIGVSMFSHRLRSKGFTVIVLEPRTSGKKKNEKYIRAGIVPGLARSTLHNMSICF